MIQGAPREDPTLRARPSGELYRPAADLFSCHTVPSAMQPFPDSIDVSHKLTCMPPDAVAVSGQRVPDALLAQRWEDQRNVAWSLDPLGLMTGGLLRIPPVVVQHPHRSCRFGAGTWRCSRTNGRIAASTRQLLRFPPVFGISSSPSTNRRQLKLPTCRSRAQ